MVPPNDAINYIAKKVGYRSPKRFKSRAEFVFRGITLEGKRVLEIGCGRGELCLWAAISGAQFVLGLEPESMGSTQGTLQTFNLMISELHLGSIVCASDQLLQRFFSNDKFDIVVLYNVINHLDETAVQNLPCDLDAVSKYLEYIEILWYLMTPEGIIIIADCARDNFFGNIGLKSPFVPTIEWRKHQNPDVWLQLFVQKGFYLWDLRWSSLFPFGKLTQNRVIHYFTKSHFVMRLKKYAQNK